MKELSVLDDALFCQEQEPNWEDQEQELSDVSNINPNNNNNVKSEDSSWEHEELQSLFSRQTQTHFFKSSDSDFVSVSRRAAVDWILKVNARHGFTTLTAVLAINYLDRLLCNTKFKNAPPWKAQLAAVACLSLAAKVEETHVPLLLDLQVVGDEEHVRHVFESRTVQRMEVLVLETLRWRMCPVTPISFLDHVVRRLGVRTFRRREFLRRAEGLILSAVSDSRIVGHLPSVVAAAAMIRAAEQVDPGTAVDYQNQLVDVMKITKEEVKCCYDLISDNNVNPRTKRKYDDRRRIPTSPNGVIDASFDSDCSDDSCVSVETEHASIKKTKRAHEQEHVCFVSIDR